MTHHLIKKVSVPRFETPDGHEHDSFAEASQHLLNQDIDNWIEVHCTNHMSKCDLYIVMQEHWPELSVSFENHNNRLIEGAK